MKFFYLTAFCIFLSLFSRAQWTDDVSKNLQVASVNASDIESVGVEEGKTWIAFYSLRNGNYDMRAQLLDSTGKKLLGDNGVLVSSKPSGSATFVFNVCINGRGELIIGYQYEVGGVLNAALSKIDQQGNILWDGIVLGRGLSPYPAILTTGETAVAWSNGSLNTISLQVVASDGSLANNSPVNVYVGNATTTRGQVVANTGGDFTLVFQKLVFPPIYTTLYAQRYNHNLQAIWPAPLQLSNQTTSAARYYSVSVEADTTYVGYYSSVGSRFNAFLQRINPDVNDALPYGMNGAHFSTDTAVNDNYQQEITIAQKDSTPTVWAVCTYSDPNQVNYGVYSQRFVKETGERLFGEKGRRVLPVGSDLNRQEGELQLTGNDKAGFIFSDNQNHIYSAKLNNKGNIDSIAGTSLLTSTGNIKSRVHFTGNDVLAVAIWAENRGNGDISYAQNITPDGVTGVLPLMLIDFSADRNLNNVLLHWTAANEVNNKGFYVERSSDGKSFSAVGFQPARNSGISAFSEYTFTDNLPLSGVSYYRLRIVDMNGHVAYSGALRVEANHASSPSKVFPNPAKDVVYVQMESNRNTSVSIVVADANGKVVLNKTANIVSGTNRLPVSVSGLCAGTYFITISDDRKDRMNLTFNKL